MKIKKSLIPCLAFEPLRDLEEKNENESLNQNTHPPSRHFSWGLYPFIVPFPLDKQGFGLYFETKSHSLPQIPHAKHPFGSCPLCFVFDVKSDLTFWKKDIYFCLLILILLIFSCFFLHEILIFIILKSWFYWSNWFCYLYLISNILLCHIVKCLPPRLSYKCGTRDKRTQSYPFQW